MLDDDNRIRYMMESVEVVERKSMPRLILSREFSHALERNLVYRLGQEISSI
jgi:hypothetical protein